MNRFQKPLLGPLLNFICSFNLKKQPKMKTAKLSDIEKVERCWSDNGKRSIQITAKGKRYTLR